MLDKLQHISQIFRIHTHEHCGKKKKGEKPYKFIYFIRFSYNIFFINCLLVCCTWEKEKKGGVRYNLHVEYQKRAIMKNILLILTLSTSLIAGQAKDFDFNVTSTTGYTMEKPLTDEELRYRVLYTNLIGAAVVTAWGVANWDYFTTDPVMADEGWFGDATKYGGADKLGHVYSTYLLSLGFASLYEYWGME